MRYMYAIRKCRNKNDDDGNGNWQPKMVDIHRKMETYIDVYKNNENTLHGEASAAAAEKSVKFAFIDEDENRFSLWAFHLLRVLC